MEPDKDWVELHDKMEKRGSKGREKVVVGSGKNALSSVCPITTRDKVLHSLLLSCILAGLIRSGFSFHHAAFLLQGDVKYGGQEGNDETSLFADRYSVVHGRLPAGLGKPA